MLSKHKSIWNTSCVYTHPHEIHNGTKYYRISEFGGASPSRKGLTCAIVTCRRKARGKITSL